MLRAFLLCLLLAVPGAAAGQRRQLPPVDQCAADASFAAFRTSLLDAIERRDSAFLLSIVADEITFNFGGGEGREAFRELWTLDRPETSGLWAELGAVLRLGCARDGDTIWAPSMFRQLDDLRGPDLRGRRARRRRGGARRPVRGQPRFGAARMGRADLALG